METKVARTIERMIKEKNKRKVIQDVISYIEADGLEAPKEKTLYAKISGNRGLDVWLIPYFAKALGVPEQDLFDPSKREQIAREELSLHPLRYAESFPEVQTLRGMVRLPCATVGAGAEALADAALLEPVYIPADLLPDRFDPTHVIVARVLGNSMEPKYNEGDILFIDMVDGREVILPDGIYLVRYGDTVQIKTVQFLGNGDIRVISFNKEFPPIQPVADLGVDWEILGKPFLHWQAHLDTRLEVTK